MTDELQELQESLFVSLGVAITMIRTDPEAADYDGRTLQLGVAAAQYRKAKVTPKKVGLFVALWKRGADGHTHAFTLSDPFEFYIIAVQHHDQRGVFIFTREILAKYGVLGSSQGGGKLGFRLYPPWDIPPNKQAAASQAWQCSSFYDLKQLDRFVIARVSALFKKG